MIADFLTKPLQGSLYTHLRQLLIGSDSIPSQVEKKNIKYKNKNKNKKKKLKLN